METGQAIGHRLAHQDESAMAAAYAAYAPSVLSYLTRLVGPADAEDVLQRTFLDACRFAEQHDPGQHFAGWLFTIARHRAIDTLRSRRHHVDLEQVDDLVGEDGRDTAERLAEAADLRTAVARLPDHERRVIELAFFEQLSQREIAARLHVPLGTVKARSSRATRRLGDLLRPPALTTAPA